MKPKLVRITTIPESLDKLLEGQLRYMNQYFEVIAISSPGEKLFEVAKKENVKVFGLEMTRKITPFKDLVAIGKLYKFLLKEKPAIVHTHTPKAGMVGMVAAKLANIPNRLHTVAGLPLMEARGLKRRILNLVEKFTYKIATKIYPNSNGLKEYILQHKFCKEDKIKVIGNGSSNGINIDYFDPKLISEEQKKILKNELNIKNEDFVFIFIGRLVGDKGINELIEAFITIEAKTEIKLILVGDFEDSLDPLKEKTKKTIQHSSNIILTGFQKDVRPYLTIANCFVFPSYREGFPNVVMQAGAMGIPCIVSDINGCNEIISNYDNGLIVPSKNTEELAKTMELILTNSTIRLNLTINSRENLKKKYDQRLFWENLLSQYKSLL